MQGMLTENCKIIRLTASTASGTSTITSAAVDMAADGGWDEVTFLADFETAHADNQLKAQQSSDDGSADAYADIEGSEIVTDTDDKLQRVNILNPTERYLKCVATRGNATVLGTLIAILSRGRKPYAPSEDYNVVRLVAPAEGTA